MSLINPSVSVIIPSFNHEKFVAEAIESVLNQSFTDFELIIIDDGSKDRSIGIIREFVKKDPRIKFFSQDNQGSHSAINKGISLSNGKYVAILNSDDRFHPDRLAILVNTIKEKQKKFLITAVNLIDQEGSIIENESHWWLNSYQKSINQYIDFGYKKAISNTNFSASTSNFFFEKEFYLKKIGPLRPLRYVLDWDYLFRAVYISPENFFFLFDKKLLDYRIHGNNTILSGSIRASLETNALLKRITIAYVPEAEPYILNIKKNLRFLHREHLLFKQSEANQYFNDSQAYIKKLERVIAEKDQALSIFQSSFLIRAIAFFKRKLVIRNENKN